MHNRQKVKLLLWLTTLLSVLTLVVVPALATGPFTLTVEKAGDGTGTVTSDDDKINCGEVCKATYGPTASGKLMGKPDVEVTLTATPDAGFAFAGWGQDCQCDQPFVSGAGFAHATCTIIGNYGDTRTCTATFGLPVGGIAVPVDKLGLVAPWMGLAALASLAVLTVALVKRRRS